MMEHFMRLATVAVSIDGPLTAYARLNASDGQAGMDASGVPLGQHVGYSTTVYDTGHKVRRRIVEMIGQK